MDKDHAIRLGYRQLYEEPDPNAGHSPAVKERIWLLNQHLDPRGSLVELWRQSWEIGGPTAAAAKGTVRQAYVSETMPGVVKAWHLHLRQVDRFVCIAGRVLVAMVDLRGDEIPEVEEYVLDWRRPYRLDVPPGFAHGWMALGNEPARILNLCSQEYDGLDELRRPAHEGPCIGAFYDWHQNRDG
jgi:dTDP-4-dehydrorhamnose 3,5-epimerase